MSDGNSTRRHPRLKLPTFFTWAIGQVGSEDGAGLFQLANADPYVRQHTAPLSKLTAALLVPARVMMDGTTPLSAQHALITFHPALDALADCLTRNFSIRMEEAEGVIQPPCNFPMPLQTAIMRLAEAVQKAQDWEAAGPDGGPAKCLPAAIVTTLESVLADLSALDDRQQNQQPVPDATEPQREGTVVGEKPDGDGPIPVATSPEETSREESTPQYVALDQMAILIKKSKSTLERWKARQKNPFPSPDIEGGGGKADYWIWTRIRPWLQKETSMQLPERFPDLYPEK